MFTVAPPTVADDKGGAQVPWAPPSYAPAYCKLREYLMSMMDPGINKEGL